MVVTAATAAAPMMGPLMFVVSVVLAETAATEAVCVILIQGEMTTNLVIF